MAIVLTKKKIAAPALEPAYDPALSEIAGLIDKVGALQEGADEINARIKQEQERLKPYQTALKELQEAVEEIEAKDDDTLEELGSKFRLEAGKRGTSRSIKDIDKIKEFLGPKLFMELATITLKNVDDYLTPPQKEDVLEEARTKRSIKIIRRSKD